MRALKLLPQLIVAGVIAVGVFIYSLYHSDQNKKTEDPAAQASDGPNGQKKNKDLNFGGGADGQAHDGEGSLNGAESKPVEDPLCPTVTENYKNILKCPWLPASIKEVLKKSNYQYTQEDCEISSRTSHITLGKRFIAWTLSQSNSCENKAYPHGLPEEKTYSIKKAEEVNFTNEFELKKLETYYLQHVDLKQGLDENKQKCQSFKESNRQKNLGTLNSELTKAQFRLKDNNQKIVLMMHTFAQGALGRVCTLQVEFPDWQTYLDADSRFRNDIKANEIFKP